MKKKYIAFVVIIVAVLVAAGVIFSKPQSETAYLKKNTKELKLDKPEDYSDLKVISNSIEDKEIIFTGEGHGVKQNTDIQFKFLNYLIDNWDLRYYVIETGYSEAMMLNEYLATGNEEILKETFQEWSAFRATKEDFSMIKKLYEKNKNLPEGKKVTILGIDSASMSEGHIKKYMNIIIGKVGTLPEELKVFENNLNKLDLVGVNTTKFHLKKEEIQEKKKTILEIVNDMENHIKDNRELYEKSFKEDLFNIEFILENIKDLQTLPKTFGSQPDIRTDFELLSMRENYTYKNFKKLCDHYPKGKYYFHFGGKHSVLKEIWGLENIAIKLQKDDTFKDKIYAIRTYYGVGTSMGAEVEQPVYSNIPTELEKQLQTVKGEFGDLIIDLNNRRSPIKNTLNLNYFEPAEREVLKPDSDTKTTDYFQGIIIIKNPKGGTAYSVFPD
ncbi:erythromycin esterase-like protein [Clostridium punense]|uniref:Erythromycin esterase-like protein n=2 Tax=Clostridium TaxID=1485 RepID=A0ABS4KAD8_9CLOT|nr:erythromycin esterase family protein [Clostridium punense]MBP2024315.1 erythromycin esterase-like protein [Clostridium punense]